MSDDVERVNSKWFLKSSYALLMCSLTIVFIGAYMPVYNEIYNRVLWTTFGTSVVCWWISIGIATHMYIITKIGDKK